MLIVNVVEFIFFTIIQPNYRVLIYISLNKNHSLLRALLNLEIN